MKYMSWSPVDLYYASSLQVDAILELMREEYEATAGDSGEDIDTDMR